MAHTDIMSEWTYRDVYTLKMCVRTYVRVCVLVSNSGSRDIVRLAPPEQNTHASLLVSMADVTHGTCRLCGHEALDRDETQNSRLVGQAMATLSPTTSLRHPQRQPARNAKAANHRHQHWDLRISPYSNFNCRPRPRTTHWLRHVTPLALTRSSRWRPVATNLLGAACALIAARAQATKLLGLVLHPKTAND